MKSACLKVLADLVGSAGVHDPHAWAVASRETSLSAHVVVLEAAHCERALGAVVQLLEARFQIHHSTIQVESGACASAQGTGRPLHA